jgi:hypothetical protein
MKQEYYITWKIPNGQYKSDITYKKKVIGYPMRKVSKLMGIELFYHKHELGGYVITDKVSGAAVAWGTKLKYANNQLSNIFYKNGKEEFIKEVLRCRTLNPKLDDLPIFKE